MSITEEEKAQMYGELLNEHHRISNKISDIRSENFEMNPEQKNKIAQLEQQQIHLMAKIQSLFG